MNLKALTLYLLALPLSGFAGLEQKSPPVAPEDAGNPLLVWDVDPALRAGLPRSFRTTSDTLNSKSGPVPDVKGLSDLHASGSATFTEDTFSHVLSKTTGPVTVFDLRQEDHLFVNGNPVSWYATNNWANAGKQQSTIEAEENQRDKNIVVGTKLTLCDDKSKKGEADASPPEIVTVTSVLTEEEFVTAKGASYVRVAVSDHTRPSDQAVDAFILAVRKLPANGWAHFHCRAGKGRTTTFLTLYDMLRNSQQVSFDDIVSRESLLASDYDLLKSDGETGWKKAVFEDRTAFVRAFYNYARANPSGRPQLWTEWLKASGG